MVKNASEGLTLQRQYATVNTDQVYFMDKKSLYLVLAISGHLAYMVIIPILIFGGIGLSIDRAAKTLPLFLLIGIGLAFLTTLYWMKKQLTKIIKNLL